jgi:protoporphyrinogen oxidase
VSSTELVENDGASGAWGDAPVVVIGAGPAGLTAAYQLTKAGRSVVVVEADTVVGGISRTVERDGWRFDLGGHRFFTKVPEVEALWHEILDDDDFLLRPRMSRIFYKGKYYDYPLSARNALGNLGLKEAMLCGLSYVRARATMSKNQNTYEGWLASRFGWRLYRTFFKTYTEKLWGVPANEIEPDFAAQRVKNLDLGKAVWNMLTPKRKQTSITSLIEEFQYPKYGPGMMWERCAELVVKAGGELRFDSTVSAIEIQGGRATAVEVTGHDGRTERIAASHVISSMPMHNLVGVLQPAPPPAVQASGEGLHYRDFLIVSLVLPEEKGFPDNWIYIHSPDVSVGRIQNFGSWSPYLVKDGRTCLGLEYFVFKGDDMWESKDDDLIALATKELAYLGLATPGDIERGYVTRTEKAYPYYDATYRDNVATIATYLESDAPNIHLVGRNGMHKYNNQDHSMYTAMLTVENILGAHHDIWSVNVEEEYHEEHAEERPDRFPAGGGGRDAPVLPSRAAHVSGVE